jgi:hypothetical protein
VRTSLAFANKYRRAIQRFERAINVTSSAVFLAKPRVGFGVEMVLVAFLGLMHLRIALATPILGRTGRMNQCGIDDGVVTQRQATVTQLTIDHAENPGCQLGAIQPLIHAFWLRLLLRYLARITLMHAKHAATG